MYQPKFTSRGEHAKSMLGRAGYSSGGDVAQDKKMIAEGVHKHERALHPGKPLTKLATGGAVEGFASGGRLDKMARGGRHKKPHTKITIVNAPQGGQPVPVPVGAGGGGPPAPMVGPMGGGPVPPQMPMRKQGGPVPKMTAGAGSGMGREEKVKEYGRGKKVK